MAEEWQHWRFDKTRERYVRVSPPTPIDPQDFLTEMSEADALVMLAIMPHPGYFCLNEAAMAK
jgi:hypothetical protein